MPTEYPKPENTKSNRPVQFPLSIFSSSSQSKLPVSMMSCLKATFRYIKLQCCQCKQVSNTINDIHWRSLDNINISFATAGKCYDSMVVWTGKIKLTHVVSCATHECPAPSIQILIRLGIKGWVVYSIFLWDHVVREDPLGFPLPRRITASCFPVLRHLDQFVKPLKEDMVWLALGPLNEQLSWTVKHLLNSSWVPHDDINWRSKQGSH